MKMCEFVALFKKNIHMRVKVCTYVRANVCVSIQAGGGGLPWDEASAAL